MTILGPNAIPPIQRSDDPGMALRLNQRIAAEVMQVAGDRVALVIEGVKVVARMTSSEQAALLEEHRFANFIVRDLSGPVITLQLLPQAAAAPAARAAPELVPNLLQVSGLPVNEWTLQIGRALLNQGLAVTPERVAELQEFLSNIDGWGPQHAQMAAAIKSAGLPLTQAALELVMQPQPALTEVSVRLVAQLQTLLRRKLPPEFAALVQESIDTLKGLFVEPAEPAAMKEMLQRALSVLGRPVESALNRLAQDPPGAQAASGKPAALTLAQLRQQLAADGETALVKDLDRFLDGLRLSQYTNLPTSRELDEGRWLRFELPMGLPPGAGQPPSSFTPAHIRIAYPPDPEEGALDAANTRLVIGVELAPGSFLQVDLSVVEKRIGARITASDEQLKESAEEELDSLTGGLEQLGYTLQTSACQVKPPDPESGFQAQGLWKRYTNEVIVDT